MRRMVPAFIAAALVGTGLLAGVASPVAATPRKFSVTAFQEAWDAPGLIDRSRAALTDVGVDGVSLGRGGRTVGRPGAAQRRQLRRAHHDRLPAQLLVSNFSDSIDDFSEPLGHALLTDAGHRRAVITSLASDVRRQGWDGISVDLESLTGRDRAGLTSFVRGLRARLPRRATLTICVMAATRTADYAAMGYDLRALAASVDDVILMTYDQHGSWENQPGPVGSLPWQRAAVRAARRDVPARELQLGVAEYGYAWRPHENVQVSDAQARHLAGARARWVPWAGEWTATLSDGSTLWWSDARSYRARVARARAWGLAGVAVWDLGSGDRIR